MSNLDVVRLTALMERGSGRAEVAVGLIDGPVVLTHPELANERIREIPGILPGSCSIRSSAACQHGTFVAGILMAQRGTSYPAISPGCTLLVRAIFAETTPGTGGLVPSTTPAELGQAIMDTIRAGARIINLSVGLTLSSLQGNEELVSALDLTARKGVIVVAAAGNQGTVGSSTITRHPWVIPVAACDAQGRPIRMSNIGTSIGKHGLLAPGDRVTSLGTSGSPLTMSGTSVAAPFVTGAIALLWSEFPQASAAAIKQAVTPSGTSRRAGVVPPLLDAWGAYEMMARTRRK